MFKCEGVFGLECLIFNNNIENHCFVSTAGWQHTEATYVHCGCQFQLGSDRFIPPFVTCMIYLYIFVFTEIFADLNKELRSMFFIPLFLSL